MDDKPTNGAAQNGEKKAEGADHEDSDDDNEAEDGGAEGAGEGAAKKKKKRKPRKKKKAGAGGAKTQTSPPRVPLSELYPNNDYPEGEICEYLDENSYTPAEHKGFITTYGDTSAYYADPNARRRDIEQMRKDMIGARPAYSG